MSVGTVYSGVVVPMVSPFTPAGGIDEPAVGRIAEHLLKHRLAGIFPLGTTGESASIRAEDKRRLVAATVSAVAGRAMVYAGIASNCFHDSVEMAAEFKQMSVNAVVA